MMWQKFTRSFILSCQNHGTFKEKLYKAGTQKGSVIFFNQSSVVFNVFIERIICFEIFNADFRSIQQLG